MSVKCVPPLLFSKTGVCRGIPIFLIFAPKHRLWVLVRTASLRRFYEEVRTCTHNLCFEQKQEKYQIFSTENFQFLQFKKKWYITWACFGNGSTDQNARWTLDFLFNKISSQIPLILVVLFESISFDYYLLAHSLKYNVDARQIQV